MNLRTFFATLISLITLTSFATGPAQIVFHGRIFVAGVDRAGSTLTITIEGQEPELIMAAVDGTYRVSVAEGSTAVLCFAHNGHISKTVVLDTQNAFASATTTSRNKKIAFDVILQEDLTPEVNAQQTVVGSIRFVRGSGLMKVGYEQSTIQPVLAMLGK
ncbi:MAG: hypothetical protein KA408_10395 [Flavobacteriales bacterium]|nr:hypothetical protein [Flavobacteriales bacterium]